MSHHRYLSAVFAIVCVLSPRATLAWDNGLAKTPPMGWNSWNKYGCNVTDAIIRQNAAAIASSGMKDAGYTYVNIDDCWAKTRAGDGTIQPDPSTFPDMTSLASYVHSLGLKLGIYTDAGVATCQLRPGSYSYENQDMATYAQWGIDYVKVDWCNTTNATGLHPPTNLEPHTTYQPYQTGITRSGRAMVLSACTGPMMGDAQTSNSDPPFGVDNPWEWGPAVANLWRTTVDISNNWPSVIKNFHLNAAHANVAKPGAWNDPDILEVGNGVLSFQESMAHFSLWAMEAAPLIAGNDVSNMDANTKAILTNAEVIAIDQDSLGLQATAVTQGSNTSVWRKALANGGVAIALLNEGGSATTMSVTPQAAGITSGGPFAVRDLWLHADQNDLASNTSSYTRLVPSHGVNLITITAKSTVASTSGGSAPGSVAPVSTTGGTTSPVGTPSGSGTSAGPSSASGAGNTSNDAEQSAEAGCATTAHVYGFLPMLIGMSAFLLRRRTRSRTSNRSKL